jgi:hypothetical protein
MTSAPAYVRTWAAAGLQDRRHCPHSFDVLNRDHHAELSAWFTETLARLRDATQMVRRTMPIK